MRINYPQSLEKIFAKLKLYGIKPIFVGGYVRDFLLARCSNDIDIELYGVESFEKLEKILQEFGDVNSVGRSFGVCKLAFDGLELDFSLPRRDSKISKGHRGFEVEVDATLDFVNATKRRDFTINAIGYDVFEEKILDPFGGLEDLKEKRLRAVDSVTFREDPLRVLRMVQFASRLEMQVDEKLLLLCREMVQEREFQELAKERVYGEIQKLFLQSPQPSIGIKLLHNLGLFREWHTLREVDKLAGFHLDIDEKEALLLYFSLLYKKETFSTFKQITADVKLLKNVATFIEFSDYLVAPFKDISDYQLYFLATKVKLRLFLLFLDAKTVQKYMQNIKRLQQRAKELDIVEREVAALLQGRDLLAIGLEPSKEFKTILERGYEAQIRGEFQGKEEALIWLENSLIQ